MTTQWTITKLHVAQSPQANTVTRVSYEAANSASARIEGSVDLGPVGNVFVAFNDLTEATVLDWLWALVNKDATEDYLLRLEESTVADQLPWTAGV